jgi:hypothetical protein
MISRFCESCESERNPGIDGDIRLAALGRSQKAAALIALFLTARWAAYHLSSTQGVAGKARLALG